MVSSIPSITLMSASPTVKRRTRLCTISGLFTLITGMVACITPLLISLISGGFYLSEQRVFQYPEVVFNNVISIILSGNKNHVNKSTGIFSSNPWTAQYHSNSSIMDILVNNQASVIFPSIKTTAYDVNRDDVNEKLFATFRIPLDPTITLSSIRLEMGINITLPGTKINLNANIIKLSWDHSPILVSNVAWTGNFAITSLNKLFDPYYHRDQQSSADNSATGKFNSNYLQIKPLQSDMPLISPYMESLDCSILYPRSYRQMLTLQVSMNIVKIAISMRPSLSQILKWAWIQYLAIAIVIYFVWRCFIRMLVSLAIVNSEVIVDDYSLTAGLTQGNNNSVDGSSYGMVGQEFKPCYF